MPTVYGSAFNSLSGGSQWRCMLVTDMLDKGGSVTITSTTYWQTIKGYFQLSGVRAATGALGLWDITENNSVHETSAGAYTHQMSRLSVDVQKTSSPQTVVSEGSINNSTGFADGKSSAFYTWTVPALSAGKTVTVSFDANGGYGAPGGVSAYANSFVTLPLERPSRDGYRFAAWGTLPNGGGRYNPGLQYYVGTSDVTLYALWTAASEGLRTTSLSAYRVADSSSTAQSHTGAYAYVSVGWSSDESLTSSLDISYRRAGSSSWSYASVFGTTTGTGGTAYCWFGASPSYAYNVRVTAATSSGSIDTTINVPEGSDSGTVLDVTNQGQSIGILTTAPSEPGVAFGPGTLEIAGSTHTMAEWDALFGGGGGGGGSGIAYAEIWNNVSFDVPGSKSQSNVSASYLSSKTYGSGDGAPRVSGNHFVLTDGHTYLITFSCTAKGWRGSYNLGSAMYADTAQIGINIQYAYEGTFASVSMSRIHTCTNSDYIYFPVWSSGTFNVDSVYGYSAQCVLLV